MVLAVAAATTAARGRSEEQDSQSRHVLPKQEFLKTCQVERQIKSALGLQWCSRKLILTKERLCFCKSLQQDGRGIAEETVANDVIIDFIPLFEITNVKAPDSASTGGASSASATRVERKLGASGANFSGLAEHDDLDTSRVLVISTVEDGHNNGRKDALYFESANVRNQWFTLLQAIRKQVRDEWERQNNPRWEHRVWIRARRSVKSAYESWQLQTFVTIILVASFFTAIISAQMRTDPDNLCTPMSVEDSCRTFRIFWWLELTFTIFFGLEVCMAFVALGFWGFCAHGSNIFDAIVVAICIASTVLEEIPHMGSLRMLRVLRLVRVFTLMKRLAPLRILLRALGNSAMPVMFVFLLLFLVLAVFSLIATEFFREMDPDNFGDVQKTAFSLFQVSTGDSWASIITRGITERNPDVPAWMVRTFFVVFVLTVGMVLMNIVIAILLDEFLGTVTREKAEARKRQLKKQLHGEVTTLSARAVSHLHFPLDPFLATLMTCSTDEDLSAKIASVYECMDVDQSGAMSREELNAGLKLFSLEDSVHLSPEDWEIISEHGRFLNANGEMGPAGFEAMVIGQLRSYVNRKLVAMMNYLHHDSEDDNRDHTILVGLKMTMDYLSSIARSVGKLREAVDPHGLVNEAKSKRSRMQVIISLKALPLRRAFAKWSSEVGGHAYGAKVLSDVRHQIVTERGTNGSVNFQDFLIMMQASKSLRASDPVSHARRIFKRLDVNNSGSLEAEELQQAVHRIEDEMTDREVLLRRMELIQDQLAATQHAQADLARSVEAVSQTTAAALTEFKADILSAINASMATLADERSIQDRPGSGATAVTAATSTKPGAWAVALNTSSSITAAAAGSLVQAASEPQMTLALAQATERGRGIARNDFSSRGGVAGNGMDLGTPMRPIAPIHDPVVDHIPTSAQTPAPIPERSKGQGQLSAQEPHAAPDHGVNGHARNGGSSSSNGKVNATGTTVVVRRVPSEMTSEMTSVQGAVDREDLESCNMDTSREGGGGGVRGLGLMEDEEAISFEEERSMDYGYVLRLSIV